jgi:pilus assembly protein Flp/PilA
MDGRKAGAALTVTPLAGASLAPAREIFMADLLARFIPDRRGATAIEYGLIAAFIAVALVAALPSIRNNVIGLFQDVDHSVSVGRKKAH